MRPRARRSPGVLPGFGLSTGFTVLYLGIVEWRRQTARRDAARRSTVS